MAETREFTRNTKILIIGEFINFILLMAFNLFLIRFLSVAEYSYFNRILIFPMILAYVTDLGLFYGCVYYVARFSKTNQKHKTRNIMRVTLITKSLIGLVLSLIIFFLSQTVISPLLGIHLQSIIEIVQFASLLLFAKNIFEAVLAILQGLMNMGVLISLKNIQIALQFIITLLFVSFGIRLYGAIVALVISTFCVGLLGVLYLYKKSLSHKGRKEKIEWASTSLIIKRGFFYSLNSIISNTKNYFFILTLTLFSFFSEVSYLKAAISVSSIFYLILRPIRLSVTPMFTRLSWNKPKEKTNLIQVLHYSLKFSILFITPVVFYSIYFATKLIPVFFGSNYSASSLFISIFLTSFFPLAFGMNVIPPFFFGQKKPRLAFLIEFLSFVFSISLAFLFSLTFQSNGFAFGVSLGAFLGLIVGLILLKKRFGKGLLSEIKQISLTIIVSGVLGFIMLLGYLLLENLILLTNEFLILLICGLAFIIYYFLYFLLLIRLNLINYTEIKFFMQEFQKIPILNKFLPTLIKIGNFFLKKEKQ